MIAKMNAKGVTIVELLVVIAASGIIMAAVTGFALNYWTNTAVLQNDEDTLVTRMNSGDYLRNALNSASDLIIQNSLTDSHTGAPDPAIGSGLYWLPIHAIPGTTNMPASGTITPVAYFSRPSLNTSKSMIMNGTFPYQDEIVIYMNGSTKQLLARVLANPNATSNRAKTTCPAASASSSCPKDILIAENVSGMGVRYFSRSGTAIDHTSSFDIVTGEYTGPDFPTVEVVELTLNLFKKAQLHSGDNTINQAVIRVALRN